MRKEFKTILIFNWAILLLAGLGQAHEQTMEYPSDSLSCLWKLCPNPQMEGNLLVDWDNVWQSGFFAQSAANMQGETILNNSNLLSFNEIDYNLWRSSNIESNSQTSDYPLILDMSDWVYYGKKSDITTFERQIVTVKTGYYWGYSCWYRDHWYWRRDMMEPFFEEKPWYPSSPAYPLYNGCGNGSYLYPMQYVEVRINLDMDLSFQTGLFTSD